jgi:hypothetical protein
MNQNSFSKAVKEFQEIYKKEFKEDLDDAEAYRRAKKLLNLYKAILCSNSFGQGKATKIYENEQRNN